MTAAEQGPARPRLRLRLLAPPLAAFLLYLPILGFPFLWDDQSFLVDNESIRSLTNAPGFFLDESTAAVGDQSPGVYRPLRNLVWALVYAVAGPASWTFHLCSVLLHALNAGLVVWLCLALGPPGKEGELAAALGGGLLAVHPLASEAVSWIKAGDDLLVAAPCLLAAALSAREGRARSSVRTRSLARPGLLAGLLGLQLLAVLAKESGVVLPGLVLLAYWTGARLSGGARMSTLQALRPITLYSLLAGALDLLFVVARRGVLGEVGQVSELPAAGLDLLLTQLRATAHGVGLLLWPGKLQADYYGFAVSREIGWSELVAVLAVVALLGMTAAMLWRNRAPRFVFAVGWWLLVLIPVSNLVPTMQFLAERFLYLALAGPAVAASGAAVWLLRSRRWPLRRVALLGMVVLAALALRTSHRQRVWSDPVALFESCVRGDAGNPRAVDNWARALFSAGRYRDALGALELLAEVAPGHLSVADLAPDASQLAAVEDVLPELMQRADRRPDDLALQQRVAELALRARRTAPAAILFARVLSADRQRWQAHAGLAVAAALEGDEALAASRLESAAAIYRTSAADEADQWQRWQDWVDRARAAARLRDDPGRGRAPAADGR